MTPKQRFKKMVLKARHTTNTFECLSVDEVVQLLLAEHRRVLALAMGQTRYRADVNSSMTTQSDGEWINRDDLLKALGGQKEEQP